VHRVNQTPEAKHLPTHLVADPSDVSGVDCNRIMLGNAEHRESPEHD
jgi:hypothetical protein